jgi:dolichyl-phosphate-mannose-protein mannosyltransferase
MTRRPLAFDALAIPSAFAALKLILHALAATRFGYFRDELYYIACAKRLAWGYVDQPPLSIALLAVQRALLGDSLWALRTLPALAGAGTVLLTGMLVRALGGGRFAQAVACLCVVLAPVYLVVDHFFSMNAFDTFFWTLAALLLLRALEGPRPGAWIALGFVLGLGLLNKWSVLWLGCGMTVGLLLTSHRRQLATPWPWIAAGIAGVMVAPNLLWEARNGWPTLEFMHNATRNKMVHTGPADFWGQQVLVMGPATLPVWVIGLAALLASRPRRPLGMVFVAVALFLTLGGSSRPNYLSVAYPPLFAAGALAIGNAAARGRAWLRPVALGELALVGLPLVPVGLPLLSVENHIAYMRTLGVGLKAQEHTSEGPLPQVFADMFGWEELTQRVARVYQSLPAADRARCAIIASNYGEAGALDFFGPRYGLPPAISPHNNYWLWGTRGATGDVIILVGGDLDDTHPDCASAVVADTTSCTYCLPFENNRPITVLRGLNKPLSARWQEIREYQ